MGLRRLIIEIESVSFDLESLSLEDLDNMVSYDDDVSEEGPSFRMKPSSNIHLKKEPANKQDVYSDASASFKQAVKMIKDAKGTRQAWERPDREKKTNALYSMASKFDSLLSWGSYHGLENKKLRRIDKAKMLISSAIKKIEAETQKMAKEDPYREPTEREKKAEFEKELAKKKEPHVSACKPGEKMVYGTCRKVKPGFFRRAMA